jgi:hypothetical protein
MADQILTQEYLKEIFDYSNGFLYNKTTRSNRKKAGSIAGYYRQDGYHMISVNCKRLLTHRLIYMWHYGFMPEFLDHADGNNKNNKIENLRIATKSENNQNKKASKRNKTGFKNVSWHKLKKKWIVQVSLNKRQIYCNYFADIELADLVAQEVRNKYHKEFARHF